MGNYHAFKKLLFLICVVVFLNVLGLDLYASSFSELNQTLPGIAQRKDWVSGIQSQLKDGKQTDQEIVQTLGSYESKSPLELQKHVSEYNRLLREKQALHKAPEHLRKKDEELAKKEKEVQEKAVEVEKVKKVVELTLAQSSPGLGKSSGTPSGNASFFDQISELIQKQQEEMQKSYLAATKDSKEFLKHAKSSRPTKEMQVQVLDLFNLYSELNEYLTNAMQAIELNERPLKDLVLKRTNLRVPDNTIFSEIAKLKQKIHADLIKIKNLHISVENYEAFFQGFYSLVERLLYLFPSDLLKYSNKLGENDDFTVLAYKIGGIEGVAPVLKGTDINDGPLIKGFCDNKENSLSLCHYLFSLYKKEPADPNINTFIEFRVNLYKFLSLVKNQIKAWSVFDEGGAAMYAPLVVQFFKGEFKPVDKERIFKVFREKEWIGVQKLIPLVNPDKLLSRNSLEENEKHNTYFQKKRELYYLKEQTEKRQESLNKRINELTNKFLNPLKKEEDIREKVRSAFSQWVTKIGKSVKEINEKKGVIFKEVETKQSEFKGNINLIKDNYSAESLKKILLSLDGNNPESGMDGLNYLNLRAFVLELQILIEKSKNLKNIDFETINKFASDHISYYNLLKEALEKYDGLEQKFKDYFKEDLDKVFKDKEELNEYFIENLRHKKYFTLDGSKRVTIYEWAFRSAQRIFKDAVKEKEEKEKKSGTEIKDFWTDNPNVKDFMEKLKTAEIAYHEVIKNKIDINPSYHDEAIKINEEYFPVFDVWFHKGKTDSPSSPPPPDMPAAPEMEGMMKSSSLLLSLEITQKIEKLPVKILDILKNPEDKTKWQNFFNAWVKYLQERLLASPDLEFNELFEQEEDKVNLAFQGAVFAIMDEMRIYLTDFRDLSKDHERYAQRISRFLDENVIDKAKEAIKNMAAYKTALKEKERQQKKREGAKEKEKPNGLSPKGAPPPQKMHFSSKKTFKEEELASSVTKSAPLGGEEQRKYEEIKQALDLLDDTGILTTSFDLKNLTSSNLEDSKIDALGLTQNPRENANDYLDRLIKNTNDFPHITSLNTMVTWLKDVQGTQEKPVYILWLDFSMIDGGIKFPFDKYTNFIKEDREQIFGQDHKSSYFLMENGEGQPLKARITAIIEKQPSLLGYRQDAFNVKDLVIDLTKFLEEKAKGDAKIIVISSYIGGGNGKEDLGILEGNSFQLNTIEDYKKITEIHDKIDELGNAGAENKSLVLRYLRDRSTNNFIKELTRYKGKVFYPGVLEFKNMEEYQDKVLFVWVPRSEGLLTKSECMVNFGNDSQTRAPIKQTKRLQVKTVEEIAELKKLYIEHFKS